jgi:hypothetical protein
MVSMEKVIVQVGKTPKGYCACMDLLPGWVLAASGNFLAFEKELAESISFYVDCAKKQGDAYPSVFDGDYEFEYQQEQ